MKVKFNGYEIECTPQEFMELTGSQGKADKALDEIQYATAVNLSKTNIELKRKGSTTITASLNGTLREGEEV